MPVDTLNNLKLFWNISSLQWFCDTGQQIEMMNERDMNTDFLNIT